MKPVTIKSVADGLRAAATVEPIAKINSIEDWCQAAVRIGFREIDRQNWLRFGDHCWLMLYPNNNPGVRRELSEIQFGVYEKPSVYFDWLSTKPADIKAICTCLEVAQAKVVEANAIVARVAKTNRRGKIRIAYDGSRA